MKYCTGVLRVGPTTTQLRSKTLIVERLSPYTVQLSAMDIHRSCMQFNHENSYLRVSVTKKYGKLLESFHSCRPWKLY